MQSSDMLRKIYAFPDIALAYLMLREDRLFDRIPVKEHYKIIEFCLQMGRKKAEEIGESSPSPGILDLLSDLGIKLVTKEKYVIPDMRFMGNHLKKEKDAYIERIYCSEYLPRPATIVVYQNTVDLAYEIFTGNGFAIDKNLIREIFIAHELYHHLEETNKCIIKSYPRVTIIGKGRWQIKVMINTCSEIAAMAFAKEVLKAPFFPKIIDLFILSQRNPELIESWVSAVSLFYKNNQGIY